MSCTCNERKKPLKQRNWEISTWLIKGKTSERLALDIFCNECGTWWRNYNSRSVYWKFLDKNSEEKNIHPYSRSLKEQKC